MNNKYQIDTLRHSAAHVMAAAVQNIYPDAKFDIGPATDNGFYYDFDLTHRLTPEDLPKIEKEMKKIRKKKHKFIHKTVNREEAKKLFKEKNQTYKLERLNDIPENENINIYQCGEFIDLCRGPHVEHTGQIGEFMLASIAGSYFRGNEKNPMLQRIYGLCFADKEALKQYKTLLEEAKKRDHRKLGTELELFSQHDNIGPGLICWHPKGSHIRHLIESFWKDTHFKNGYDLLYTPHIGQANLWQTSGHLDCYSDAMYSPIDIDDSQYYIKPMNCPFHIEIYKNRGRSYRELPLRWAELGTVYRFEKSGVLHGLLRVRGFTQDDAHIFCTHEQVEDEICEVLRFCLFMWKSFGFKNVKAYLATKPEKAVGEDARWEQAQKSLINAITRENIEYEIDEGGGAFYGPKIDLKIKDAIGREWQTSTIQFDFNLPQRFNMTYVGDDGQKHQPYMIHRALLGSIERFFGILTEHYSGNFPLWLSPEQVRIIPVTEQHIQYAQQIQQQLQNNNIRTTINTDSSNIGPRIKKARKERIPYMLILGDKEVTDNTLAVRKREEGELGNIPTKEFIEKINLEIAQKL